MHSSVEFNSILKYQYLKRALYKYSISCPISTKKNILFKKSAIFMQMFKLNVEAH